MAVTEIPAEYPGVTPYLVVQGAAEAIRYYVDVFGAMELFRMASPDGKIGHAELEIGGRRIMLADEHPEFDALGPKSIGGTPVSLLLYVEDVDAVFAKAVAAGGKELRPVKNQFYGDRSGFFEDPFGHKWSVATHVEDVSPEEMERRMQAAGTGGVEDAEA